MEHLLIIRFSAMGDVAMMVPVVYSLAHQYPHLHITVLSKPFARHFFDNLAPNVSFMSADLNEQYRGVHGLNALFRRLIAKHFTSIADFHDVLRSKYLRVRFVLGRNKIAHINKHRQQRRALCSLKHKKFKQISTVFDNYKEVLAKLGYPIELEFHSIFGEGKGDFSLISDRIEAKKENERWIGIAPFAAHRGKIYPQERMQKVVDGLLKTDPNCKIFFYGNGKEEHSVIHQLIEGRERCTDASEILNNLYEELVLMSHLDTMVSMDSANMHFASLVGTRVVSIWGATHPYAGFLGFNQKMEDAIGTTDECRPCSIYGNKECAFGDYRCLAISPDIVVKKILNN